MKGIFMVVVGPTASGKTELVKALVAKTPNSARLITTTTRERRPGETDDYFFVSREEFQKGIEDGDFFEYAEVHGNLYGSSKKVLQSFMEKYDNVFAIIDVKGAQTLKNKIPHALVIFINSGSIEDIRARLLKARQGISEEELRRRLDTAVYELSLATTFDVVVQNKEGHFEETVAAVEDILFYHSGYSSHKTGRPA